MKKSILFFSLLFIFSLTGCTQEMLSPKNNTNKQSTNIEQNKNTEKNNDVNQSTLTNRYPCKSDDDCVLIDKNFIFNEEETEINCCADCKNNTIDYSLEKYIAVNRNFYDENNKNKEVYCKNILCPHCSIQVKIINEQYEARCINNFCAKSAD